MKNYHQKEDEDYDDEKPCSPSLTNLMSGKYKKPVYDLQNELMREREKRQEKEAKRKDFERWQKDYDEHMMRVSTYSYEMNRWKDENPSKAKAAVRALAEEERRWKEDND
jgi:hypothetical protein